MRRREWACVLGVLVPLVGCAGGYDVQPPQAPKTAAPPQAASPRAAAPGKPSGPVQPVAGSPGQTSPGAPTPATSGLAVSGAPRPGKAFLPVQLSAGVALPQTLPDGTAMGFSIDYQFTQGQPEPAGRYYWVVERTQGPPARQPVRLEARGTLQQFITDFRPEHGPFQTHLEDGRGSRLSASAPLR